MLTRQIGIFLTGPRTLCSFTRAIFYFKKNAHTLFFLIPYPRGGNHSTSQKETEEAAIQSQTGWPFLTLLNSLLHIAPLLVTCLVSYHTRNTRPEPKLSVRPHSQHPYMDTRRHIITHTYAHTCPTPGSLAECFSFNKHPS